jgi:hypothetical protein
MTPQEHREVAEEQLAGAELMFDDWVAGGRDDDRLYNQLAHLRQAAIAHALLSGDQPCYGFGHGDRSPEP